MSASAGKTQLTIVGAGAMACLFGARLSSVAEVTFTDEWKEGIEAIRTDGITVDDNPQHTVAPLVAVPWDEAIPPADLVLILVKAWQTEAVSPRLESLLKPDGIALTLQNGFGNLEKLGPRACLGVTYQAATLAGPGYVRPGGAGPTWVAGPEWIAELFRNAGIECRAGESRQLDSLLWGKLVVNCGINAVTALLRIPNGELLRRPDAMHLMDCAARECAEVARAKGIDLPFTDPVVRVREVARLTAVNHSSMLQDVLRGAPTECESIHGAVVRLGNRLGISTPVNEVLLRLIRSLEGGGPDQIIGK
jgi:2-dehydropantoate 2-reductase